MPNYSTLERLQMKVLDKAVSLMMAAPAQRAVYDQFTMIVANTVDLAPKVRRITFRADEFADHTLTGADEYFGLLMPPPGATTVTMPSEDRINVRQAIRRLPEDQRPELRWYTIRGLRRADAEIDVDFVLHGDAGPGTRWASRAEAGQQVGFRAGNATYQPAVGGPPVGGAPQPPPPPPGAFRPGPPPPPHPPAGGGPQLLAADETALPALSSILEAHPDADIRAYVEVPDDSYRLPIAADREVTWLVRGDEAPGTRLLPAVADVDTADLGYAWLCGESAIATGLRRHLVKERGVDRRRIMFSGYWKVGAARE